MLINDVALSEMDIAIIGMSGRFPGAKNIQEFWQNLCNGVESIQPVSDEQIKETLQQVLGYLPTETVQDWLNDPHYIKVAAALEDIDLFDAPFFGYSPAEAEMLDPQQRIFLENVWEALEDAGYADTAAYQGLIGVYAGAEVNSYHHVHTSLIPTARDFQALLGNESGYLTTRASYKLHLTGPSIDVQTACSTSLVALHLACQSLRNGECDIALAGGVVAYTTQKVGYFYQEGGIFSSDGHCRPFDAQAHGVVFANGGIGIIALKRLQEAYDDGDQIYAVIKGSAINNDGNNKAGYTAPGIEGQKRVILEALAMAEIQPDAISYIETHGTATLLGDPIEITALTQGFRKQTQRKQFCALGSVKSNIGHLGVAAGVAGIIKTALALHHKMLPASLHYVQANPHIDFINSPFYVNTKLTPWATEALPRSAGVSSFGIGGTNAHVILQEAPDRYRPIQTEQHSHLVVLSAKTNYALDMHTTNLINHVKKTPALSLADLAFSLQVGRKAFPYRRVVVSRTPEELCSQLTNKEISTTLVEPEKRSIAFMFSGQGSQYSNMGKDLYDQEPIFRQYVDQCAAFLQPILQCDIREILYPQKDNREQTKAQLNQTSITQPIIFVIEYALAQLWMKWNVHPDVMIGHSIGEYVAACLSGVFNLEDALILVASRGRLMQKQPPGAMVAISSTYQEIETFLKPEISLAAQNGPHDYVLSGPIEAIEELEQLLAKHEVTVHRLQTSHAFHSPMMNAVLEPFTNEVQKIQLHPPTIPFISNLTGELITDQAATDPHYWAQHLRQCVQFSAGLQTILTTSQWILIEVGAGRSLASLAQRQYGQQSNHLIVSSLRHVQDQQDDQAVLLQVCGRLWGAGVKIDWQSMHHGKHLQRISLPTYPFERKRYWHFPERVQALTALHRKPDIADWFYTPSWKRSPLPLTHQGTDIFEQNAYTLVFQDDSGMAQHFIEEVAQRGTKIISVQADENFHKIHDGLYAINPASKDHYHQLLQALDNQGHLPTSIAHFWTIVRPQPGTPGEMHAVEQMQNYGFYSLLFLSQALGTQMTGRSIKLAVISNDLQDVVGGESYAPERATVLGACKTIQLEYAQIDCKHIDIQLPQIDKNWKTVARHVLREMQAETDERTIAYRRGNRWIETLEPVYVAASDNTQPASSFREHGVYLITGGLGGIGLALAHEIAQQAKAHIILLGRSTLPARSTWKGWLATHDEQEKVCWQLRQIQSLEQLGATIHVESADVTDRETMQNMLLRVQKQYGTINGVIHAAGTLSIGIMQFKTATDAHKVLAPKLQGTLVLADLLHKNKLDFFVLCSSLYSVLGGLGQADYSAANAFLDHFAVYHSHKTITPTYAINWDAWQEVGMAEDTLKNKVGNQQQNQFLVKDGIFPHEGREIFCRVLSQQLAPQQIISTRDLHTVFEHVKNTALLLDNEPGAHSSIHVVHPRPENIHTAYITPTNDVEERVATIWQKVLGIEKIGIQDNFFDLGGDSVMAIKIMKYCLDTFKVEISVQQFFLLPTIASQASIITQKQMEMLDSEQLTDFLQDIQSMSEADVMALLQSSEE